MARDEQTAVATDTENSASGHTIRPQGKGTRGRIFNSDFFEKFTRVKPGTAVAVYGSVIVLMIVLNFWIGAVSAPLTAAVLFIIGLVSWTLFEYLAHRYIFHLISESAALQKFSYTIHGIHHEFPRDEDRLFMPPAAGLPIAAVLFGIFYAVMGAWAFMFFTGFISGYVAYAYLHTCIHRFRPPRMLKFLWRHHLQHHYKCPELAYGVSSPFWDMVFHTMPPKEEVRSRLPESSDNALQT